MIEITGKETINKEILRFAHRNSNKMTFIYLSDEC